MTEKRLDKTDADCAGEKRTEQSETDVTGDECARFIAVVKSVKRIRFKLKRADNPYAAALFAIMGVILVCTLFIGVGKNDSATVALAAVAIAAVVAGIAVFFASKARSRTPYYCCYARTDDGVFCMSVMGKTATVLSNGKAYRIEKENFYTLDEKSYSEWLDGEGVGLYSALRCDKKDIECTDGVFTVAAPHGGSHEYFLRDGEIEKIISVQPVATDDVDRKTGEIKYKYREYIKTEPSTDFVWEIPAFVLDAFDAAGEPVPDLSMLRQ